jgi:hypothetical protein
MMLPLWICGTHLIAGPSGHQFAVCDAESDVSATTGVQFLRRDGNEKCPALGSARLWRKACRGRLRVLTRNRFTIRGNMQKLALSLDSKAHQQQNATEVIKKAETQNLSRNELTFGHEHGVLIVTKGLEWKANSTFR